MRSDLMGIIFSNANEGLVRDLTEVRCLGSVPFGGRYRLIDFALSNMVHVGVSKVGVITKSNYRSLLDHLGSGKPWDLARKKDGISLFPPYINYGSGQRGSRVEELSSILSFLNMSKQEYVFLCDCDVVCNIDLERMMQYHLDRGADVTLAYRRGNMPRSLSGRMSFAMAPDGRIKEILISPQNGQTVDYSLNMVIVKRSFLISVVQDAASRNYTSIARDIFQRGVSGMKLYGYPVEGFAPSIDSMQSYFAANMALLDREVRRELFTPERPVYTKVRDEMPAKYGLGADVSNSLIADGCVIEGRLENCILFRGVHVAKGATLQNCIIMQGGRIGENAKLAYVTTDKDVTIAAGRTLVGFDTYPAFVSKGVTV